MLRSLNAFLWPGGFDSATDTVRARSLVIASLLIFAMACFVRVLLYWNLPPEEAWKTTTMAVVMGAAVIYPVLLWKTRKLQILCACLVWHATIAVMWRVSSSGGLLQPAMLFIEPIIVGGFFFIGRRGGLIIAGAFIILITLLYINPGWNTLPVGLSPEQIKTDLTLAFGGSVAGITIISVLISFLIGEFDSNTRDLEQASRAKTQFLATMSHEIRTPIHGVLGMADVLAEKDFPSEDRQMLRVIQDSGTALLTILNDILDLSKIEAGRMDFEKTPFNLHDCVEDVAMLLAQRARDKDLTLLVDIGSGLNRTLVGDPGRLRQVLTNLVGNALKFTETGHVCIKVRGMIQQSGVRLSFKVIDTGIGIPADKTKLVFEDFSQADDFTSRKYGGTGLGLPISRKLVAAMGGELAVQSVVGKGTVFSFSLQFPEEGTSDGKYAQSHLLSGKSLQIAMADGPVRATLQRLFEEAGMRTDLGPEESADLILLDSLDRLAVYPEEARILLLNDKPGPSVARTNIRELAIPFRASDTLDLAIDMLGLTPVRPVALPIIQLCDGNTGTAPCRLLVADDSATNRTVIEKMLKDPIYDVTLVEDGAEALAQAKEHAFDLILMDISMPSLDGIGATRALRKFEIANGQSPTPVLALTAHALVSDQERFQEAGMNGCLTKPIRKAVLVDEIAKWVSNANAELESRQAG